MNSLKTIIVAVGLSIAAAVGMTYVSDTSTEKPIPQENLGAIPGNSVEGNYFTVGGVEMAYVKMPAIAATSSVPCVTKNPWNASSTLVAFTAGFSDTPIDTTPSLDLSTSSNPYLSSTSTVAIVDHYTLIPSGGASEFDFRNTTANGMGKRVLQIGEYVGLKSGTTTPGNEGYTGSCAAIFQKL